MRIDILKKILIAFLILSLFPLVVLSFYARSIMDQITESAIGSSKAALIENSTLLLEARARSIARLVEQLLQNSLDDLQALALLPFDEKLYLDFSLTHKRSIWIRIGTPKNFKEITVNIPLYREITYADIFGIEKIRIVNDSIARPGWDVSSSFWGLYGEENYFQETQNLAKQQIFVSHLLGRHLLKEEQLGNAEKVEDAVGGESYEGIIRFAKAVYRKGQFQGVVSIALDHRHLMELTQHVLPIGTHEVVFPSYSSGNYAFLFDDQGWIITHPKFWDIRGYNRQTGKIVDPLSPVYNEENMRKGLIPFNLFFVPFIHTNYQLIAKEVLAQKSGVTRTSSVGGVERILAYAPIPFNEGEYHKTGLFGGVTLGAQIGTFYKSVDETGLKIKETLYLTVRNFIIIILLAGIIISIFSALIAKSFTKPILLMADKVKAISKGHFQVSVDIHSGDELEILGRNFEEMGRQLALNQTRLESSLKELEDSKAEIESYNQRLEKQVQILKNIHHISQLLNVNFDQEEILHHILKACVDGIGFTRAILYLYTPEKKLLECVKTYGFDPIDAKRAMNAPYLVDQQKCVPTQVFSSGKALMVNDARTNPFLTDLDRKILSVSQIYSYAYAPIRVAEQVFGVLGADYATSNRKITKEEKEFLEIIANEAAMVIQRVRLLQNIVRERDFKESILSKMMSGLMVIHQSGQIHSINRYALKALNLNRADVASYHMDDILRPYPELKREVHKALDGEPMQNNEIELRLPVGHTINLEIATSHLKSGILEDGKTILVIFRDVTNRKKLEKHLRRSDRLVSIGTLAAGIAHEIRNPLTGISLLLDDLHDRTQQKVEDRQLIQRSLEEIEKLEKIVTELLDFASRSSSKLVVKDLNLVIEHTLFLIKKQCKQQKVRLVERLNPSLPPVQLDPEKIKQALLNILLNAITVLPNGGEITILTRHHQRLEFLGGKKGVEIKICDNGPGISQDDIEYIFDPFFTRNPKGSGLGLSITHTIIDEHNGKIIVESDHTNGAVFRIFLPLSVTKLG